MKLILVFQIEIVKSDVNDDFQEARNIRPSSHLIKTRYPRQKIKMTGAPSEDSDQPGHPPSLIKVFV